MKGQKLFTVILRDITERKRAEEALTSQRKELQVILESVPAMIFYKDKENHFVRTNKAFEDAMGLPKEKLQGQSLFDLYPKEMAEAFWNDDKDGDGVPQTEIWNCRANADAQRDKNCSDGQDSLF